MAGKTWFHGLDPSDLFTKKARRNRREEVSGAETALKIWYWRLELVLVVALLLPVIGAGRWGLSLDFLFLCTLTWRPWRNWLTRRLHYAHVRRSWMAAVRDSGAADPPPGTARRLDSYLTLARPTRIRETLVGELLTVRIPGRGARLLEQHREELAACLKVRDVRIARDPSNSGRANVLLVRYDPFDTEEPLTWPNAQAENLSISDWIPLGIDENGGLVGINLLERNMLIGGEPGSGKSVALGLMVATAALDTACQISLIDGKDIEFAPWEVVAANNAGTNLNYANRVLRLVQEDMNRRLQWLREHGEKKVTVGHELGFHLLVVDELAYYVRNPDSKASSEFLERLLNIVARGRAAGVITIVATQKPDAKTVDSALRDLFGFRIAFRCNTPQASDTVLGQGWASAGTDASTIPGRERGVGYLLAEGERPVRYRGHWLDDDETVALATRGAALRAANEWVTAPTGELGEPPMDQLFPPG